MTDELDGPTARDFGMTTTPEAEPISAEGLAELLDGIASLSTPLKFSERVTVRGARNTLRVQDAEIAILRSRIAELEAGLEDERELARDLIRYG